MEHLDEGTIHAWIDGAFDATRSREIEAHVAGCPACSAAVAEARGLIAASSRILTALDDVPAGVVPKRAPAAAPVPLAQPKRRRIAAWIPALAAATLVVAVGLQVTGRADVAESTGSDSALELRAPFADQRADTVATQPPAAPAPQARLTATAGESPTATTPAPSPAMGERAELARRTESRAVAASAGAGAGPVEARRPSAAPPAALGGQPIAAKENAAMKSVAEAAVGSAVGDSGRVDRSVFVNVPALPATLAGCYRVEREVNESALQKAGNVAAIVGGSARALGDSRDARARAPVAQRAQAPAADMAALALPAVVRLDTTARPPGLPVLAERKDSVIGWWTRVGRDTASVRFLTGVAVTLTARNRVTCP